MAGLLQWVMRGVRRVIDHLESTVREMSADPLLQSALEADLGLPPGTLDPAKVTLPTTTGIDQYVNAADPKTEQIKVTFDAIKTYATFWTSIFEAAKTEDPTIVADELLYRLFETTTVDLLKFDYPSVYALMRLAGVMEQDLRLTLEESFAPEVPASWFTNEYYETWARRFEGNYLRFRLDQDPALKSGDAPPSLADRQLGLRVFGLSDILLGSPAIGAWIWESNRDKVTVEPYYGWELPPAAERALCAPAPPPSTISLAEHIASRASTFRISAGSPPQSALLTQLLLVDSQDRLGWLVSLGGTVTVQGRIGSSQRPLKVTASINAPATFSALIRFSGEDRFKVLFAEAGVNTGATIMIEPEQTSNRQPVIAIPATTGTRLEIGEFALKAELHGEGFGLRAQARKSALVIVASESDAAVSESLGGLETRIEFDLGLTIDERGLRLDGGSRLGTMLSLNRSLGPVKLHTLRLELSPSAAAGGSQLSLVAAAAMSVELGPLTLSFEGVGVRMGIGIPGRGTQVGAAPLVPGLLQAGDFGFKAPEGIGIAVESDSVSGGGFLFRDPASGQYAGALQLSIRERWTLTAVGLVTTRLPDGTKGFSLLIIGSLEFEPPYPLFLGITLQGAGLLVGIHRTMDADALRAGLRNQTLDAILFPQDVVANAPRLLNALRAVFPPARGQHLLGLTVKLGFGATNIIRAELGVVYEFGARRWAVMGQLHAELPSMPRGALAPKKKILELHVDAIGIWDLARGEFSLDAALYQSQLAGIGLSGDVAVRMRKGDSSYFLLSAGGYHPEFAVPTGFPALQRLKISLVDRKDLRLLLTGYFAITSNTRQVGARLEFFFEYRGFSIEAVLSFDGLWEGERRFVVQFDVEFKLKYKGVTFFGVDVYGRLTGPDPKRVVGKWSIDLWLTSVSKSFDKTYGEDSPPAALPAPDPLAPFVAALREPGNWSADLPDDAHRLVTLRVRPGSNAVLVHPLGRLGVRQTVLPLGIRLDRFAGAALPARPQFAVTAASVGGRVIPPAALRPVNEQFAAADFLELSDDERIARPSFEAMPAGVTLPAATQDMTFGADSAVSAMDYESLPEDGQMPAPIANLPGKHAIFATAFGPAARSPLRVTGAARFAAPGQDLLVGDERYVVTGVSDLGAAPIASAPSYAAAAQALDAHLVANPGARGALQVVPAFDAAPGA